MKKGLSKLKHIMVLDGEGGAGLVSHTYIKVKGVPGEIIGCAASFLPPFPDESSPLCLILVKALPFTCHIDPTDDHGDEVVSNYVNLKGKAAFVTRGIVTFANKILRCERYGASCVIVGQNVSTWPYEMTDTTGESSTCTIPAVVISLEHAKRIEEYIRDTGDGDVEVEVGSRRVNQCLVCQDSYHAGEGITQMPCQHFFHKECILPWLKVLVHIHTPP